MVGILIIHIVVLFSTFINSSSFKETWDLLLCRQSSQTSHSLQGAYKNPQGFIHLVKNLKKEDFILRKREQIIVKNVAWVTPCSVQRRGVIKHAVFL